MEKQAGNISTSDTHSPDVKKENSDANTCIGIGAAVGAIGATAAAITGAVCPICIVATPGLIGVGLYRRWRNKGKCPGKKQKLTQ